MATARFETWLDTDLSRIPIVVELPDDTFTADSQGNKVGVRLTKNGQPIAVTGTVKGYIIKPDGTTVTVNGSKSANTASVVLPSSAYTKSGRLIVSIKVTDGDAVTTLGACQCIMHRALTEVNV